MRCLTSACPLATSPSSRGQVKSRTCKGACTRSMPGEMPRPWALGEEESYQVVSSTFACLPSLAVACSVQARSVGDLALHWQSSARSLPSRRDRLGICVSASTRQNQTWATLASHDINWLAHQM
eukprot:7441022-Alexandrium_andersonii.AAC.1